MTGGDASALGRINLYGAPARLPKILPTCDLAVPNFGLIFIGFTCGKAEGLPEAGLSWINSLFVLGMTVALLRSSAGPLGSARVISVKL